jgi:hypothetical protein
MGINKVLKMRKILGILLAFCFVMSVTVAAVSAAPNDGKNNYNNNNGKKIDNNNGKNNYNNNNGKNNYNNNNGKNNYNNNNGKNNYNNNNGKKKYFMQGKWGYKKVKHNKDKNHKSFWYTNEKYWIPGYWY